MREFMKKLYIALLCLWSVQAQAVSYTYDDLNRLETVTYGNGVVITYEYDDIGNREGRIITSPFSIDQAPQAIRDEVQVISGQSITFDPRVNDVDAGILSIINVTGQTSGAVSFTSDSVTYQSNAGFVGEESLTYTVSNTNGLQSDGVIEITVLEEGAVFNRAPVARDDYVETLVDEPVSFSPLANDYDPDGAMADLQLVSVADGVNGTVSVDGVVVTYDPFRGYVGSEALNYVIQDSLGASFTGVIYITVSEEPVNPDDQNDSSDDVLTTEDDYEVFVLEQALNIDGSQYSERVAVDGEYAVMATDQIYIFQKDEMNWEAIQAISFEEIHKTKVYLKGAHLFVINEDEYSPNGDSFAGSVSHYLQNPLSGLWEFQEKIFSPVSSNSGHFGKTISYHNGYLAVAEERVEDGSIEHKQAVHVYHHDGVSFQHIDVISAAGSNNQSRHDENPSTGFGDGLFVYEDSLYVSDSTDTRWGGTPSVYIYDLLPSNVVLSETLNFDHVSWIAFYDGDIITHDQLLKIYDDESGSWELVQEIYVGGLGIEKMILDNGRLYVPSDNGLKVYAKTDGQWSLIENFQARFIKEEFENFDVSGGVMIFPNYIREQIFLFDSGSYPVIDEYRRDFELSPYSVYSLTAPGVLGENLGRIEFQVDGEWAMGMNSYVDAHIFRKSTQGWEFFETIHRDTRSFRDEFKLQGSRILSGNTNNYEFSIPNSGVVYQQIFDVSSWEQSDAFLVSPAPLPEMKFGHSLDFDGNRLVVNESVSLDSSERRAHSYQLNGLTGEWVFQETLAYPLNFADGDPLPGNGFGYRIYLSDDKLLVYDSNRQATLNSEYRTEAHLYQDINGAWLHQERLLLRNLSLSYKSRVIFKDHLLIYATEHHGIYVYEERGGEWIQAAHLYPNNFRKFDIGYGDTIAYQDGYLFVSKTEYEEVDVYQKLDGTWSLVGLLKFDELSYQIAHLNIQGDELFVGQEYTDNYSSRFVVNLSGLFQERRQLDVDDDGLTNAYEIQNGTNPNVADTDGDGLSDGQEVFTHLTSPTNPDTDGDGILDGVDESPLSLIDADQDGFDASVDCDDSDPLVNPDAEEVCDDIDNDCDGFLNNTGTYHVFYRDADGDGFGNPLSVVTTTCLIPGYVVLPTDCDDQNEFVFPGQEEMGDLVDNNCDGLIDENTIRSVISSVQNPVNPGDAFDIDVKLKNLSGTNRLEASVYLQTFPLVLPLGDESYQNCHDLNECEFLDSFEITAVNDDSVVNQQFRVTLPVDRLSGERYRLHVVYKDYDNPTNSFGETMELGDMLLDLINTRGFDYPFVKVR
jgi:hypothetical protein